MMLLDWIPKAYAATVPAASNTALLGGETGVKSISKFSSFVLSHIDMWAIGLAIVIGTVILAKIASTKARDAMIRAKGEEVQENALVLVERMTKMGIMLVGITIALAINGLNFTAVIGAISLGIGFALKSFIENFISSVMMLAQNRIRIGDLVDINGFLGRIVSIDMRTTVLQQLDGSMVTIPNQTMLVSNWTSYSANPFRRVEILVGVAYNTDLPTATSLIRGVIAKNPDVVIKPEPSVMVDAFAESSITIRIWFWVEASKAWMMIKSNLTHRIKKAFDEVGISITCPVRVLKIDQDDREFLKTMDSLKKGIVPDIKPLPTQEQLAELATKTGAMPQVPYNVFEAPKPVAIPVTTEAPQPFPKPMPSAGQPPKHL
jgi:small conductance mechanosensitive channel